MIHSEKKRISAEVTTGVSCDRCQTLIRSEDVLESQEMLFVDFTGGFGAVMGDGKRWRAELCQTCVQDVLGPFLRQVD